jgi:hypothetical protein
MVELRQFQRTPESPKAIEGLGVSAEDKAVLVDRKLDTEISYQYGIVCVQTAVTEAEGPALIREIGRMLKGISGVKKVPLRVGGYL